MICPVSSKTITDVDIVCVTAADMAAAPVLSSKQQSVQSSYLLSFIEYCKQLSALQLKFLPCIITSECYKAKKAFLLSVHH